MFFRRISVLALILARASSFAAESISYAAHDGVIIHALVHGRGERGIVLAHGGRFNKESWQPQAAMLAASGFRVLALDFRPHPHSGGVDSDDVRHLDVLGAVRYLRKSGAEFVYVIGASMGGDCAAKACEAQPAQIDRLVLLAAGAYTPLTKCKARKLFIMSQDDIIGDNAPRITAIRGQYHRASHPREFIVLPGSAHAQAVFATDQGQRLMSEILRFLRER